ncbi:DNA helicase-2/ATP-dependent DNA helicase PcrA [Diaminobutyricimonas aerilata]|uniref:DNA 3'-5' helicase n=1 Tax=Diaminobutyricimonas aerilata TaxID=1162967 RepID=A0A2M9CI70_9MICO|nr:ATP-dependent DNA helicase [Diaminobutyricimonas aerilata]PJJ71616.1 DNA helicase-2/ATP-dependent DNA helicase PcrA [Diaminobutyricimonas aerilata]
MTDALEIAAALGNPPPTPEQRAVIEAPLEPTLVVAGAGSGKTETMANRVLWLLANGHVRAGEVLGLTFTRKAAGELGHRLLDRIRRLAAVGLAPEYDEFEPAVVATYNSFANTLYRDNAALLGRENDGAVLSDASAWQLARSIVIRSAHPALRELDKSIDVVTAAVLRVSTALGENTVDPERVRAFTRQFASIDELPLGPRGAAYEDDMNRMREVLHLPMLLDLAGEYADAKVRRGLVEYSDQVALALRILETFPKLGEELRERHKVVLLDEYQDTSVVQTRLLAAAFRGHAVMAVGDPHQSIYGWRGASAANLEQFGHDFAGGSVPAFSLSTSWRNGTRILDVANTIAAPLSALSRVPVATLQPGPRASELPVDLSVQQTVIDEASAVARWFATRLQTPPGEPPPSAALLLRTRKTLPFFLTALRDAGIPTHVLGVGGLLAEPEIADLVCALTVVHDPTAGSPLLRLLAGSRWRLGAKDLAALRDVGDWLRDRDYAQRSFDDDVRAGMRASLADGEGRSIVDALDFVAHARDDHRELTRFSPVGLERLRDAGRLFRRLRERAGLELVDFVGHVLQELRLDIEVAANEARPVGSANIEALFDAIASYVAIDDVATLGGFLSWLREAEKRDDLSPRPEDPEPGTVQILTVHGSKGLEWDLVAVPRLVADELPSKPLEGTGGWVAFGGLPYEFRGDVGELPVFGWRGARDRKELKTALAEFKAEVGERFVREERRLAYVAVTRARHRLLLSASYWATQTAWRKPSPFLVELAEAGLVPALPEGPEELEENPLGELVSRFTWPRDPLGHRRPRVEAAATQVTVAEPAAAGPYARDLELLLAERAARLSRADRVSVPARIPASRFKDFVGDPAAIARELRRPLPERPYRATRLGTLFHGWVEARATGAASGDLVDAFAHELDLGDGVDRDRFAELQATFERSEWGALQPIEVEREVHLVLAGQVVVCKIDAVFERNGRIEIVDWKTGRAPTTADDLAAKRLQLALYRLAYARWRGIDPADVDAVFYFVADDRVIRPDRLEDEEELVARWRAALVA